MIVIAGCTGDLSKKKIFPAINKVFTRELARCMGGSYAKRELDLTDGTLSSSTSAHNLSKHSPLTVANPEDDLSKKRYLEATESGIVYSKLPQSDVLKNNSIVVPRIIGYARSKLDTVEFIQRIDPSISYLKETVEKIEYCRGEYSEMVERICSMLESEEKKGEKKTDSLDEQLYFYLAVPPEIYPSILEGVQTRLNSRQKDNSMGFPIVLIEKPIGISLETFLKLKAYMSDYSERFLCVDHYMFKNVLVKYAEIFKISVLHELIKPGRIKEVKAYFNETIGVEGRESYYNTSGACRDVMQNHLLLAVATVLGGSQERIETLKLIEALTTNRTTFGIYKEYADIISKSLEVPEQLRKTHSETSLVEAIDLYKKASNDKKTKRDLEGIKETFIKTETRIGSPWNVPLKMTAGKKMGFHFVAVILILEDAAILEVLHAKTCKQDYTNPKLISKIIKVLEEKKTEEETEEEKTITIETDESQEEDNIYSSPEESEPAVEKERKKNCNTPRVSGKIKIKITPKESISVEIKYKGKLAKKIDITIPNTEDNIDAYEHLFRQLIFEKEKGTFSPLSEIKEQWRIVDPILDNPEISRIIY